MLKFLLPVFLFISSPAIAQHGFPSESTSPPEMGDLFNVKETFRYEVKYGFFKLGWVNVELLSDSTYEGKQHKLLLTEMESNSSIPFIGKELDRYYSLFFVNDEGLPVESKFWKDNVDEEEFKEIVYTFDREEGIVHYKEEDDTRDTLALEEPATSGHVIFYFSRLFAGSEESYKMPVYVSKKKGYVIAENSTEKEERNYEPFDDSIMAYKMNGTTENISGPFGFSGDFRAWFLDDDLRVPLEARVKVIWGNVIVRLIEYNREEL
ncbi:DUF3108 domain-containing protein [Gracilimonas mengyeensis]|uniref:DUF3108 domain-containing protein n=1 Tax=Gracilimonas mengyeensis TaxID=1302730 RepID=A0A521EYF0_9BACT|nr:DUF3108 domain-containing protein [Gracilimonas mengyeensis]SMO88856.1 Protein of unknown function [Gracilimonas mengyeensis]